MDLHCANKAVEQVVADLLRYHATVPQTINTTISTDRVTIQLQYPKLFEIQPGRLQNPTYHLFERRHWSVQNQSEHTILSRDLTPKEVTLLSGAIVVGA